MTHSENTKLEQLIVEVKQIRSDNHEMREQIRRLDESIRGNGRPGVLSRLVKLETMFLMLGGACVLFVPVTITLTIWVLDIIRGG